MRFTSTEGKILAVGLFLTLVLAFLRFTQPGLTGYIVYVEQAANWGFDNPEEYDYDNNLIELSDGEARLKLKNATEEIINGNEVGIPAGEEEFEFESEAYQYNGRLKNMFFESETPSETTVKFKIKAAESEGDLNKAKWLGPTGKNDFYTVSGQEINPEHPETGYFRYKATMETESEETPVLNSVTISYGKEEYPESAQIETQDLTIEKVSSWGSLATTEELNGQTISYYYSTDSGDTWSLINNNELSSANTGNGKVRIRAVLNSDGLQTPVLYGIGVAYTYVSCEEEWEARYTECGVEDKRIKYYADANGCGTGDGLPADNGTAESCDYCIPTWENVNGSCTESDVKEQAYYYANTCCSETGLASDCTIPQNTTAICDYCTPLWSCRSYGECQADNQRKCLSVTDSRNCYELTKLSSDSYTSDYLGFEESCSYDSAAPLITGAALTPEAVNVGEAIELRASISDESNITATVLLKNEKGLLILNKSLSEGGNRVFTATIDTSGITKGTYTVDISAIDEKGNSALERNAAMAVIATKEATVKEVILNDNIPHQINTTSLGTNKTTALLKMFGRESEGKISVATYYEDFRGTTKPAKEVGRYVDIVAEEKIRQNITNTTLRVYYTDEELEAANINETSVRIYFYNETSKAWEALGTTVNEIENYAEAVITHYSTYSLFGEEKIVASEATETTEADEEEEIPEEPEKTEGRGGAEIRAMPENEAETSEESREGAEVKDTEKKEKAECSYGVTVELPKSLSLEDSDASATATLTNTGTCEIELLGLEITGEASKVINVTPSRIENLATGTTASFNLTKAKEAIAPLQGFIVVEPGIKTYKGEIKIQGITGSVVEVEERIEINVEIGKGKDRTAGLSKSGVALFLIAIAAVAVVFVKKKKKRAEGVPG